MQILIILLLCGLPTTFCLNPTVQCVPIKRDLEQFKMQNIVFRSLRRYYICGKTESTQFSYMVQSITDIPKCCACQHQKELKSEEV